MKNIFFLSMVMILLSPCYAKIGPSAITWKPNGGRFGDDLLSYSKTKWLSMQFNIPIICQPFSYSDELMLHENETFSTEECLSQFSSTKQLIKEPPYILVPNNSTLYVSRWKTEVDIDWFDAAFLEELKKNIAPRQTLEKVKIPEGVVSVAVHVRNGGTFAADTPEEKERCPLRFVPEEFFIEQVHRIAYMFPDDMIYVHIFTDHPAPTKLVKKFKYRLNNPRITFGCRAEGNSHKSNVLEDFFSMMDFDCLVRPGSHFTRFVQRLGNNTLVIYPESVKEVNGKKVIDVINLKIRPNAQSIWKTKKVRIA